MYSINLVRVNFFCLKRKPLLLQQWCNEIESIPHHWIYKHMQKWCHSVCISRLLTASFTDKNNFLIIEAFDEQLRIKINDNNFKWCFNDLVIIFKFPWVLYILEHIWKTCYMWLKLFNVEWWQQVNIECRK